MISSKELKTRPSITIYNHSIFYLGNSSELFCNEPSMLITRMNKKIEQVSEVGIDYN